MLDLRFVIKSELPHLLEIGLSPFENCAMLMEKEGLAEKADSQTTYPKQFSQSIIALMLKIDKQVREFNGMKQARGSGSTAPMFSSYWHKIVDMDETDVEIRYNSRTIVKEDYRDELPKKYSSKPGPQQKFKTIGYEPEARPRREQPIKLEHGHYGQTIVSQKASDKASECADTERNYEAPRPAPSVRSSLSVQSDLKRRIESRMLETKSW